jgi:PQQ-dependent catabolism-associated CXXCW motif protein
VAAGGSRRQDNGELTVGRTLRGIASLAAGLASLFAFAQIVFAFADEDRDWGVAPPPGLRATNYHGNTPTTLPGARVVTTLELQAMLEQEPRPFLVDVLSGPSHRTLPGSLWLNNGGLGDFDPIEEKRYLDTLALLSGENKQRHLVFFCSGAHCWLSYNAALRAVRAGYTNVYWYRGGVEAWKEAGLPTTGSDPFPW